MKNKKTMKYIILLIIQLAIINILEVSSYAEEIGENTIFDEAINFSISYHEEEDVMPYCLITPSTADKYESIPLLIYLHGGSEINSSKNVLLDNKYGVPQIFQNYPLQGFNAYILMPHLKDGWSSDDDWDNEDSMKNVIDLIDKFVLNHNVDTDNIVLTGGSMGGRGALYVANNVTDYFSKLIVMSGAYSSKTYDNVSIPTRGYVGESGDGTLDYMKGRFATQFGKENLYILKGITHATILHGTFKLDEDNNNRSDIIEWSFNNVELHPVVTGVELHETNIELFEGQKAELIATVFPENAINKEVKWSSENDNIAKVENGIVTAISEGTTNIVATTVDGKFTDNCKVTVQKIVLNSKKYLINENLIITKVLPNTSVTDFISNFTTNGTIEIFNKKAEKLEDKDIITTGTILKIKEKNLEYKVAVTGDLDGNGKITATDIIKLKRYIVKLEEIIDEYIYSADIDYDNNIRSTDILKLKRVLCNMEML